MIVAFTAASAIIPSILLVWFFKSRDAHPEPSGVLWLTFFFGVLSIIPTLCVAMPVMWVLGNLTQDPAVQGAGQAFFSAAFPEELFKMCALVFYASRHKAFDEPMDGIVYGVVASLGFATFENVLYTMQGGLGVAVMRAFTAVPMHAACGAIMGYYVGQARYPPAGTTGTAGLWVRAYIYPVVIHGLYDAPLLWIAQLNAKHGGELPDSLALSVLLGVALAFGVLLVAVIWTLRLVGRLRREQLRLIEEGRFVLIDDPDAEVGADVLEPPLPRRGSSLGAWILIVLGFLSAGFGGLFLLGGIIVVATEAVPAHELGEFMLGCGILSLPPLLIGVIMFVVGLKKLPPTRRRRLSHP